MDKKRIASMHTLMEFLATKIVKFTITNYGYAENPLNDFTIMFPGILDQIQMLSFYQPLKIFEFNILMNWLTKQTNDGKKQKIIQFHENQEQDCLAFINRIKQVNFENVYGLHLFFGEKIENDEKIMLIYPRPPKPIPNR
jgi:hypothetical protein